MKSLKVDFAMNRGHEMIIERAGGIKRTELDELELQMLRSSSIPHLLPVDWLEIDGHCTFRYSLADVTMLSHRLQREPLTMLDYYVLVLGLIDALIQCEDYMLRFDGCLLQDQLIFVGKNWQDIQLAYVPLAGESAVSQHSDLLTAIVRWTSYVEKIDGSGLKRILHLMNMSHWPIVELRSTLLDLIDINSNEVLTPKVEERTNHIKDHAAANKQTLHIPKQIFSYSHEDTPQLLQEPKKTPDLQMSREEPSPARHLFEYKEEAQEEKSQFMQQDKTEAITKLRGISIRMALLGALLGSALVWRFVYMNNPNQQMLLISAASTLLMFGLAIFISKLNSKVFIEPTDQEDDFSFGTSMNKGYAEANGKSAVEFELHSGELRNNRWHFSQQDLSADSLNGATAPDSQSQVFDQNAHHQKPSIAEPTVLLARDERKELSVMTLSWLKRVWEGKEERVELIQPSIMIGRTGGPASYIEAAGGISRLHIEIERNRDGYCAKDLGSRNGSMLNGEQMIPYKEYKLKYGDQIQLAGKNGPVYELIAG